MTEKSDELEKLEMMIDHSSLLHIVSGLVTICFEKAEHVRSIYDDRELAKTWEQDAKQLEKALGKLNN